MKWILILMVLADDRAGVGMAIDHIPFNNQAACESALATIDANVDKPGVYDIRSMSGWCVPEGSMQSEIKRGCP